MILVRMLLIVLFALSLSACSKKTLSREQCTDMLENMQDIYGQDDEEVTDKMIDECTTNHNFYKVYDCVIDAETKADMSKCGLVGARS